MTDCNRTHPLKLLFTTYLFCRWKRYKCLHKRQTYLYTQKNPTLQPPFSMDYNFVNSANRAIGFYDNGIFCFQRPRKNTLVTAKLYCRETPWYPAQTLILFPCLEEFPDLKNSARGPHAQKQPCEHSSKASFLLLWVGQQVSTCTEGIRQCVKKTVSPLFEQ